MKRDKIYRNVNYLIFNLIFIILYDFIITFLYNQLIKLYIIIEK